MNCKQGDLAYIVDDGPYAGKIVNVEKFHGDAWGYSNCWWVTSSWEMKCMSGTFKEFLFPDDRLRPISGAPVNEEIRDEVPA